MRDDSARRIGRSTRRFTRHWQAVTDQEAAFGGPLHPDRPAMTRGDLGGDRQPEARTGAIVLSPPESCSGPRQVLVGQAGAIVTDDQFDSLAASARLTQ